MQINSIRPKTGKGDNQENKKPRVVQLVCSSTTHLEQQKKFFPCIVNIPEMALEFRCKNV